MVSSMPSATRPVRTEETHSPFSSQPSTVHGSSSKQLDEQPPFPPAPASPAPPFDSLPELPLAPPERRRPPVPSPFSACKESKSRRKAHDASTGEVSAKRSSCRARLISKPEAGACVRAARADAELQRGG